MPRILELLEMPDGRLGVVLDMPPTPNDPDSVTLWTAAERDAAIASAVKLAREGCAELAENYSNAQYTTKDTWSEGFAFARKMIAANIRGLPKDL